MVNVMVGMMMMFVVEMMVLMMMMIVVEMMMMMMTTVKRATRLTLSVSVMSAGQIELYTHLPVMRQLVDQLQQWEFRVCGVFLVDSQFMVETFKVTNKMATVSDVNPLDFIPSGPVTHGSIHNDKIPVNYNVKTASII